MGVAGTVAARRRPLRVFRGRPGHRSAALWGSGCLFAFALATIITVVTGLLGPSAAEPRFDTRPASAVPPWFWTGRPSAAEVSSLVAAVVACGLAAVACGSLAVRRGWAPRAGPLLALGATAAVLISCVPPVGTTDPLSYAAYGRLAAQGWSPYSATPDTLAATGDPVGLLALAEPWRARPSVYGPLATAEQWLASLAGGSSMLRTVWVLSVVNAVVFVAVGVLLLRLAGPDPVRRTRSQVLWTLNPLLLWHAIGGVHVDLLAVLFVVAAFCALRSGSAGWAGLALGAAGAVKLTSLVLVLPFVYVWRRDRHRLGAFAVTVAVATGVGYAAAPGALTNAVQIGDSAAIGTPWREVRSWLLDPLVGPVHGARLVGVLELVAVVVLAVLLLAAAPRPPARDAVQQAAVIALALTLAYLLAAAYVRAWYDVSAWALLALAPLSWLDAVLPLHTAALTLPFIPGMPYPLHNPALTSVLRRLAGTVTPLLTGLLVLAVALVCLQRWVRRARARPSCAPGLPTDRQL